MTATLPLTFLNRGDAAQAVDDEGIHWPRPAAPDRGWHRNAKCADGDPTDWDLPSGYKVPAQQRNANRVCFGCPVVKQCAADALRHRDRDIIRAGVHIPGETHGDVRPAIRELARRAGMGRAQAAA